MLYHTQAIERRRMQFHILATVSLNHIKLASMAVCTKYF